MKSNDERHNAAVQTANPQTQEPAEDAPDIHTSGPPVSALQAMGRFPLVG